MWEKASSTKKKHPLKPCPLRHQTPCFLLLFSTHISSLSVSLETSIGPSSPPSPFSKLPHSASHTTHPTDTQQELLDGSSSTSPPFYMDSIPDIMESASTPFPQTPSTHADWHPSNSFEGERVSPCAPRDCSVGASSHHPSHHKKDMILFYMSCQLFVDAIQELIVVKKVICNDFMNSYQV